MWQQGPWLRWQSSEEGTSLFWFVLGQGHSQRSRRVPRGTGLGSPRRTVTSGGVHKCGQLSFNEFNLPESGAPPAMLQVKAALQCLLQSAAGWGHTSGCLELGPAVYNWRASGRPPWQKLFADWLRLRNPKSGGLYFTRSGSTPTDPYAFQNADGRGLGDFLILTLLFAKSRG